MYHERHGVALGRRGGCSRGAPQPRGRNGRVGAEGRRRVLSEVGPNVLYMGALGVGGIAIGALLCVALSVIDVREHRLPNRIVAALAVCRIVTAAVRVLDDGWPFAFVVFGFLGFGVPFLLINVISPAALGFGDVKLAFALGVFVGAFSPGAVPVALGLVAVTQLVLRLVLGPRVVAFGPILIGVAAVCVGPSVFDFLMGSRVVTM